MITHFIHDQTVLGLVQAGIAIATALAIAFAASVRGVDLRRDASIALARGLSQIVLVGLILVALLRGPWWTSIPLLAAMMIAAARTSSRRTADTPSSFRVSLYAIAAGAGAVIAVMTALGVIEVSVSVLVPIGSMLVANSMNANALALERLRSDVASNAAAIETGLTLGAAPSVAVSPYVCNALRAGLMPPVNNLRSLGIVWIPGVMAGMVLSGSAPLYASIYQFVVLAMIFSSSGLTCLLSTYWMSQQVFTRAEQLILPAGHSA